MYANSYALSAVLPVAEALRAWLPGPRVACRQGEVAATSAPGPARPASAPGASPPGTVHTDAAGPIRTAAPMQHRLTLAGCQHPAPPGTKVARGPTCPEPEGRQKR